MIGRICFGALGLAAATAAMPAAAQTFPGEILISGFGACPPDTLKADGRLLPIQTARPASGPDYRDLYLLYGTAYGGDGRTTFALPDMSPKVIAINNIRRAPGAKPAEQADKGAAPAMQTELPIVYCVVVKGSMAAK